MGYTEPRAGRSPLFYIGMGCLVLVGIGFIGCVAVGFMGYNMYKGVTDAAQKPIPQEQVIANLKDIPPYPNAPMIDVPATRMMRAGMLVAKSTGFIKDMEVGIFGPKDPYEKIRAFYDTKLKAAGYTPVKESEDLESGSKQWSYRKGTTVAMFQYFKNLKKENTDRGQDSAPPTKDSKNPRKGSADSEKDTVSPAQDFSGPVLTIMRMDGVKEGTDLDSITNRRGSRGGTATEE